MGLRVDLFKNRGRSFANGGTSDLVDEVTVVNVAGPFEPCAEAPAALLVRGNVAGHVKLVDAELYTEVDYGVSTSTWLEAKQPEKVGPMFGGTIAYTSDQRWIEAVRELGADGRAVDFHDRWETTREYAAMST